MARGTREGIARKQLAQMTGNPQRHIGEMENGKRGIGKERARKLAEALYVSAPFLPLLPPPGPTLR